MADNDARDLFDKFNPIPEARPFEDRPLTPPPGSRIAYLKPGEYVVTAAEKKVLEGMADANIFSLLELSKIPEGSKFFSVGVACKAELDRREKEALSG